MGMNDFLFKFAISNMKNNPEIANSPLGRQFIQILQTGDTAAGEQLANNLCNTYGESREEALRKSMDFFNI